MNDYIVEVQEQIDELTRTLNLANVARDQLEKLEEKIEDVTGYGLGAFDACKEAIHKVTINALFVLNRVTSEALEGIDEEIAAMLQSIGTDQESTAIWEQISVDQEEDPEE